MKPVALQQLLLLARDDGALAPRLLPACPHLRAEALDDAIALEDLAGSFLGPGLRP